MTDSLLTVAASAPSMALRYAAAFFLVVVGIGLIYALVRLGGTLGSAEKLLTDVDSEVVPLLKQATETLDGVNSELDKVDVVMSSVVDVTEKVDQTTRVVESAITVPAKKAAAFGAGVSQAVSSFFNRGSDAGEPEPARVRRAAPRGARRPATVPPRPTRAAGAAGRGRRARRAAARRRGADAGAPTRRERRPPTPARYERGERRVRLWGTLIFGTALAGAGLAYYVRDRSQTTGQSYVEVLRQLPREARRGYGEARRRAQLALDDGLRAARSRERQVDQRPRGGGAARRRADR